MNKLTILISCTDQVGLVTNITSVLASHQLNIIGMREFVDEANKTFFTRIACIGDFDGTDELKVKLLEILPNQAEVNLITGQEKRIAVLVTKEYHCLSEILIKNHFKTLGANVQCVIGNYEELRVNRKDKYYRGLEKDLNGIRGLSLFSPDETLTYVAQQHAKDLSKHNIAGHNSYDGRTVQDRISKYYPGRAMSENLAFGFSKGLANVCMLLLDKNVPDLGHRKSILGTSYNLTLAGVNIRTHPGYKYCAVIDFISEPATK